MPSERARSTRRGRALSRRGGRSRHGRREVGSTSDRRLTASSRGHRAPSSQSATSTAGVDAPARNEHPAIREHRRCVHGARSAQVARRLEPATCYGGDDQRCGEDAHATEYTQTGRKVPRLREWIGDPGGAQMRKLVIGISAALVFPAGAQAADYVETHRQSHEGRARLDPRRHTHERQLLSRRRDIRADAAPLALGRPRRGAARAPRPPEATDDLLRRLPRALADEWPVGHRCRRRHDDRGDGLADARGGRLGMPRSVRPRPGPARGNTHTPQPAHASSRRSSGRG